MAKTTLSHTNKGGDERVKTAYDNALSMMKEAGFAIDAPVEVFVDPQLPFMGYTMPRGRGFRIVVAGRAVESGLLEGLLVHEMSHIYRMQTNHPSHNGAIIEEAIDRLGKKVLSADYQQKIVHDLLNDIQDLYADDISFQVLGKTPLLSSGQMSSFLQDWIRDEPVKSNNARQDRWMNASTMAHNARAIAQMSRHRVQDTGNKGAMANQKFLSQIPASMASQFEYFRNLLGNLKENITEAEYRNLLVEYLNRFVDLAEKN